MKKPQYLILLNDQNAPWGVADQYNAGTIHKIRGWSFINNPQIEFPPRYSGYMVLTKGDWTLYEPSELELEIYFG